MAYFFRGFNSLDMSDSDSTQEFFYETPQPNVLDEQSSSSSSDCSSDSDQNDHKSPPQDAGKRRRVPVVRRGTGKRRRVVATGWQPGLGPQKGSSARASKKSSVRDIIKKLSDEDVSDLFDEIKEKALYAFCNRLTCDVCCQECSQNSQEIPRKK